MPISRYRNVAIVSGSFYETLEFPQIDINKIPVFVITPTAEDRLDTLAAQHLGSGEYWWIIAVMNDIDWAFSFTEGKNIVIPVNLDDILRLF